MSLWQAQHESWRNEVVSIEASISFALQGQNYGDCEKAHEELKSVLGAVASQDLSTSAWQKGMDASSQLEARNYGHALEDLREFAVLLGAPEPSYGVPVASPEQPSAPVDRPVLGVDLSH